MNGLRILWRIIKETYYGIKRSGLSNAIVVSILAVSLSILGGVLQFNDVIKQISQNLDSQLEFSVYLKDSAIPEELAQKISKFKNVDKVEIVTKDLAWRRFTKKLNLDSSTGNPLPDTLHVNIKNPRSLESVIEEVKKLSGIEQISYAPKLFSGLNRMRSVMFSFGIFITLILAIGTVTIVSNTIQLVIKTKSLEIEILRLMGVDDWYIRGPFVFHGIIYGFTASLFAFVPLLLLQLLVWDTFENSVQEIMPMTFAFNSGSNLGLIYAIMAITGILVAGLSSYLTTEKYIRL